MVVLFSFSFFNSIDAKELLQAQKNFCTDNNDKKITDKKTCAAFNCLFVENECYKKGISFSIFRIIRL